MLLRIVYLLLFVTNIKNTQPRNYFLIEYCSNLMLKETDFRSYQLH